MEQFPVSTANLVVNHKDQFLMVKEGKEHVYGKWDFPGGSLEEDESPEECVVRETIEETGYKTTPDYIVGIYLEKSQRNGKTVLVFVYKSTITGKTSKSPEDGEILDHKFFRFSRLTELDLRKPNRHKMIADYLKGEKNPKTALKDTRRLY